jgi:hypothetical protein
MVDYTTKSFRKLVNARERQHQMKRLYGYTPSIFKITHHRSRKVKYVVVKPKGIKRIR